jgi:2-keto-4-pentenoate hydratase/2-oxohepta-3-ene-1,7-dioic acid hydratase in catechol pathway
MLFSIAHIISFVSQYFTLQTGDLIFTGTPSGVGPVKIGDKLIGKFANEIVIQTEIK